MAAATLREIGSRIRARRAALGMSQTALASLVHISRNSIVDLEAGRGRMSLDTVLEVLDALGLALAFEDGPRTPAAAPQPMDVVDLDALVAEHRGR